VTFVDVFGHVDVVIGQSVIDGISKNESTVNWAIFLGDDWISGQFFGLCLRKNRRMKEMATGNGQYVNTHI
jgi:hypothetical protein